MPALTLTCAARTDIGRRTNNEDAVLASQRLVAIADGVGGAAAGEVASATVIMALAHLDKCHLRGSLAQALPRAIEQGNEALRFTVACRPELAGMSTTLTAVALDDDGVYVVANVGDSRTYLYRDRRLLQLTRDDSLVQALLDAGVITREQARRDPRRSVVLDALDGQPRSPLVALTHRARAGDRLLLCSDGLSDVLACDAIAAGLGAPSPRAAAEQLVEAALAAGSRDNVSAVVADVVTAPAGAPGWVPAPARA